jgi:DNA polymerase-1
MIHTLPPKDESKRVVTTPKGYLLSYFDISGAEVRTIAYLSKDPVMLDAYSRGVDPYINAAKIITPGMEESVYWGNRTMYKIMLLGKMYG